MNFENEKYAMKEIPEISILFENDLIEFQNLESFEWVYRSGTWGISFDEKLFSPEIFDKLSKEFDVVVSTLIRSKEDGKDREVKYLLKNASIEEYNCFSVADNQYIHSYMIVADNRKIIK